MGTLRRQKKRAPRCMGAFRQKNGRPRSVPKRRSKSSKINAFRCFFGERSAEEAPSDLSATLHGNAIFGKNVKNTLVLPLAPRRRRTHAASPKVTIGPCSPRPPGQLNGNPSPAGLSGKKQKILVHCAEIPRTVPRDVQGKFCKVLQEVCKILQNIVKFYRIL